MEFTRCFRCMEDSSGYPCVHCGYDPQQQKCKEYALVPGTILNGKYVVGIVLGQGGFGITYIGWDLVLECKVAIKEYYPSGMVSRSSESGNLHWYDTPQSKALRDTGLEMFLKEARKMSRVRGISQVVHILDLFQQNDTAYIVMDFIAGTTLKEQLSHTDVLSWEQAKAIFFPAIRAMAQVHEAGLIHRDLSPDNLMILPDGSVKILDLGAAKDLNVNAGASSVQVAKGGFSPLEQYTQRGGSGPWSDVYAMAATLYFSLTGVMPPPVVDRMEDDQMRWDLPSLLALPASVREALRQAMAIFPKNRTQSMDVFLRGLEIPESAPTSPPSPQPAPVPLSPAPKKKTPLLFLLPVVLLLVLAVLLAITVPPKAAEPSLSQPETTSPIITLPESTVSHVQKELFPLAIQPQTLAGGGCHSVALKEDGTVVATGDNGYRQSDVSEWQDIVAISATWHTLGLRSDGTVVAAGDDRYGQCQVSLWQNIVAVDAGYMHSVGLQADGTVVAVGNNDFGECDVSSWRNIVAISAGSAYTLGLQADGTVIYTGCIDISVKDPLDWQDVISISAGANHCVGLRADGTVVAAGSNNSGECDVSAWRNIVAVSVKERVTIGLRADGTVVATGRNDLGQCDVSGWRDIVAISPGRLFTLGLRTDGTVVATGSNANGECNVSGWSGIRIPEYNYPLADI